MANETPGERRRGGRWCGWTCLTSSPRKGSRRPGGRGRLRGARWAPSPVLVRTRARHPGAGCGCRLRWGGGQGAGPAAHCAQRCAAPAAAEAWVEVGAAAAALQPTRCLGSALLF